MVKSNLDLMIGRAIRVDRGGPESRMGKLLAVKDDHIIVYIEDEGMLYYKIDHIKSISLDTKDFSDVVAQPNDADQTPPPKYIDVDDFVSVLQNMKYHWVQVNRGGPEKVEGVLVEADPDQVTLISNNEIIQILPFHIRNISYGLKKKENDNNKDNDKKEDNKQAEKQEQKKDDKKE